MRKFIINIIYFLIVLLALNAVLYYIGEKIYFGEYREVSLDFHAYLLSDSHGLSLGDYTENCGVYNFSAGSDSYLDMKRKISYLHQHTLLDTIYISVDDHTLSPYRDNWNNMDRSSYFITREDCDNVFEYLKRKYITNYIIFFQPKTRTLIKNYLLSEFSRLFGYNIESIEQEISPWNEIALEERNKSAIDRFQSQFPIAPVSDRLLKSFIDIITFCKENNIELIGIKFPLSVEYNKLIGKRSFGADSVLLSYSFNVLDFRNMFDDNDLYFQNQDHLNKKGGKAFVELFCQEKQMD